MLTKKAFNCLFVVTWFVVTVMGFVRPAIAVPAPAKPAADEVLITTDANGSSENPSSQQPPMQGLPKPISALPSTGPGKTGWMDVGSCALLAAAVVTIGRSAGRIAKTFGDVVKASHLKVSEWVRMDPSILTTIDVIASILGYKVLPKSIYEMSIENFWRTVVLKLWAGCENVAAEFWALPFSVIDLMKSPQFYIPGPNDSPGIRTGRYCADMSRGWTGTGLEGCKRCCEGALTAANKMLEFVPNCVAVCNAQFQ